MTMKEIYETISECIANEPRVIDPRYIQLFRYDSLGNAYKITANDRNIELNDIIYDGNIIEFEELPFPLEEVTGKNVVKVQHFFRNGNRGEIYTELVE